jgi:hypothetical protein
MNTVLVWLLVSLPTSASLTPVTLVERFASVEECQRVSKVLIESDSYNRVKLRCIQAMVVKS